ncbi:hypothetical protein [Rhodoferax sp. BLA1]|uniref:hypothetical protein n=1 Tax=Rhodoferax sp. BLA1 TaxID=2576062 RepID=UPI0015D21586|nr:hypothetical protein [Rhodoferax sp. BLA1]
MSMTQEHLDLAMKAVGHVIQRIQADPRLAYLMGPGTEAFDLLIAAAAAPSGLDEDFLGEQITGTLVYQPVVAIGATAAEVDQELLARIALYDDGVHDRDDQDDLNMLVNHFVRRGLEVAEAARDTRTKELF